MTTLSQIYNKWLQKGNELDPETARENIASYLDSHIDKLADSMVEKSGGTVSKEKVIDDSYEILNTNPQALTDTIFIILDKIKEDFGFASLSGKSEDFDYFIDDDGLPNFKARFKKEYFDMAMEANAKIESGKSYTIQNDYGAYGKYQIMWANYVDWGRQVGIDVFGELSEADKVLLQNYLKIFKSVGSYNKLRRYNDGINTYNLNLKALDLVKKTSVVSKSNQEKIAKKKFYSYFLSKGDWGLCVASWYCGPGNMTSPDKIKECKSGDAKYPDATGHVNKFLKTFAEMGGGKEIKKVNKEQDTLNEKISNEILNNLFIKKANSNSLSEKDYLNRIIMHFLK